jgi:acetylornithine deacetylase
MAKQALDAVALLERLVGFDTTSRNSNLALIDFVADYLDGFGVPCALVRNADGSKANLHAVIGPDDKAGIMLSGHSDVVPVDGQDWSSDPFTLTRRDDGRLVGRGSADMKGFIACALQLAPAAAAHRLRFPLHLAFSYDEEVGGLGAPALARLIADAGTPPRAVIVGEPTGMRVVDAHKGVRGFVTTVTGREAHSSQPQRGANAILAAASLLHFLDGMAEELRRRGDPSGRFDPPCTTLDVGTIEGGTAHNIVPRHCRFHWGYRFLPDQDPDEILRRFEAHAAEHVLPRLRATAPDSRIETRMRAAVPAFRPAAMDAVELARGLSGRNETEAVSYCTEAGIFEEAGMPTVICGPGHIDQAHRADEYVETAQIDECTAFLRRLLADATRD